jgi:thiol:disulfide interchange protein DsbD
MILIKRFYSVILSIVLVFLTSSLYSQIYNPVNWSTEVKQKKDEATLIFKASIEKNWHLYATQLLSDDGPIATEINFEKNDNFEFIEGLNESKFETMFDPIFEMEVSFHEKKAKFSRKILIKSEKDFEVKGSVYFMVCDDKKCLPPEEIEFTFNVKGYKNAVPETANDDYSSSVTGMNIGQENQVFDPVHWSASSQKANDSTYILIYVADIDPHWHLYSQFLPSDDGPVATTFTFNKYDGVEYINNVGEGEYKTEYDPNFDMDLNYFETQAIFRQVIHVSPDGPDKIESTIEYMTCDDKRCLPPELVDFTFDLKSANNASEDVLVFLEKAYGFDEGGDDLFGMNDDDGNSKSLLGLFFIGFLLGFAALLTPCVFPMIPMTVSFFTKQSKSKADGIKNAIIYGFFIIIIYTGLGLALSAIFGPDVMNLISTDPYFNIFMFVLLVIFGISFLGAFEIQLPASWANKADKASDKGGIIGIFFMAATLAIVSFSCTGPIVGSALAGAAQGGYLGPATIMFGFSLALALPFGLFAAFPGWLNSMPKSGGWLNSVKVVLGLLEIGFAFKFLSNADLVWQLGWLKREIFIAIWIAISGSITMYLFNFIRFPHDSVSDRIGVTRFFMGLLFFVLTIYMVPGLTGSPLKIISGFPPPVFYSEAAETAGASGSGSAGHHIEAQYTDYWEAMEVAKRENKPLLVDFTGWACVNCRKMEESVWPVPAVAEIMKNDVILVSLYVDERTKLPENEWRTESFGDKDFKIKTIGNKWTYMEVERYGTNAQPFYVILDHNEKVMSGSASYDSDPKVFLKFLEDGVKNFKAGK